MESTLKAAREQRRIERLRHNAQLVQSLVNNPVVQIVAGYLVLEYAERRGWVGPVAATVAEAGVLSAVAMQQLAPIAPDLLRASEGGLNLVTKAAPLLLK